MAAAGKAIKSRRDKSLSDHEQIFAEAIVDSRRADIGHLFSQS
jgi:hypothetical protein